MCWAYQQSRQSLPQSLFMRNVWEDCLGFGGAAEISFEMENVCFATVLECATVWSDRNRPVRGLIPYVRFPIFDWPSKAMSRSQIKNRGGSVPTLEPNEWARFEPFPPSLTLVSWWYPCPYIAPSMFAWHEHKRSFGARAEPVLAEEQVPRSCPEAQIRRTLLKVDQAH